MARKSTRIKVRDGFTLKGRVPPLAGVHDGLLFDYRPALPERVAEYLQAAKPTARKTIDAIVSLLVDHVVVWEEDGPVTETALRETYHGVLVQMVDYVTGYTPAELEADLKNSGAASH